MTLTQSQPDIVVTIVNIPIHRLGQVLDAYQAA
jgi:hypothetical protein